MISRSAAVRLDRDKEVASGSRTKDRRRERSAAVPVGGTAFRFERGGVGASARRGRTLTSCVADESRAAVVGWTPTETSKGEAEADAGGARSR